MTTPASKLTARQKEIVALLRTGLGDKAIAGVLGVSVPTVRFHLQALYAVHKVHSRCELLWTLSLLIGSEGATSEAQVEHVRVFS